MTERGRIIAAMVLTYMLFGILLNSVGTVNRKDPVKPRVANRDKERAWSQPHSPAAYDLPLSPRIPRP